MALRRSTSYNPVCTSVLFFLCSCEPGDKFSGHSTERFSSLLVPLRASWAQYTCDTFALGRGPLCAVVYVGRSDGCINRWLMLRTLYSFARQLNIVIRAAFLLPSWYCKSKKNHMSERLGLGLSIAKRVLSACLAQNRCSLRRFDKVMHIWFLWVVYMYTFHKRFECPVVDLRTLKIT